MGRADENISIAEPSECELAYLAGIIDADGCIVSHYAPGKSTVAIQVGMVDRSVITWLHEHFGGSLHERPTTDGDQLFYIWRLSRQADLHYLGLALLPHLKAKGAQVWALLRVIEHRRALPKRSILTSNTVAERAERPWRTQVRDRERYEAALAVTAISQAR